MLLWEKIGEEEAIMGETTRTVDLNAHVNNIECQIETANNIAKAVIAFDNLGYGTITAIKFIAQGFNSFGDAVKVNGQDKFFLIIQDISIEKSNPTQWRHQKTNFRRKPNLLRRRHCIHILRTQRLQLHAADN